MGALLNALIALGMSREQALKYQARLQAGEFLLTVIGTPEEIERARGVIEHTGHVDLQSYCAKNADV